MPVQHVERFRRALATNNCFVLMQAAEVQEAQVSSTTLYMYTAIFRNARSTKRCATDAVHTNHMSFAQRSLKKVD